jgi:hypothetical protein
MNEIRWYEVFHTNEKGEVKTLLMDLSLEPCLRLYRKKKLTDKSVKIDKWIDNDFLPKAMSYKSIMN